MASTTVNGVVRELPFAILKNFRAVRTYTVAVVDRNGQLRALPRTDAEADLGVVVYLGDTISLELAGPCNEANAALFDLIQVTPATGVEAVQSVLTMANTYNRRLRMVITAINASSGLVTFTTAYPT